jgi:predicted metal-binding membrane protein
MARVSYPGRSPLPLGGPAASTVWPVLLLIAVAGACWALTVKRMQGMDMGPGTGLGAFGWFAVVWVTMMAAMMLPSLAPIAVAYSRAALGGPARTVAGALVLATGYLLPWAAFGGLAYAVVEGTRSLAPDFLAWDRAGQIVAAGVILAAAVYELTTAKRRCLQHCRDAGLLPERRGVPGALVVGIEQGGFCVGCSGALMAALFALGVMSIAWMLVIAALIAFEKLLPWRSVATGATAAVLAVLGLALLVVPEHVPWLTIPMSM